jgi:hypothetical protein
MDPDPKSSRGLPPVGQLVLRLVSDGIESGYALDWLCQRRLGDEQCVLWWGYGGERADPKGGAEEWRNT